MATADVRLFRGHQRHGRVDLPCGRVVGETARVEITTASQSPEPPSMLAANAIADALEAARSGEIVRRYQERPTPLVRDRRKGFRTGRLDLVLAGHFDLMDA